MQGKIVFVGAGGAGLSNIVGILRDLGYKNLIGINNEISQITKQLEKKGIQIFGHGEYQVKAEDIIIYSSATQESVEVQTAKKLKQEQHTPLLMWDYFEFLGEMSKYFKTIGFTGTNGKSSSSAMGIFAASKVLKDFGLGIVGALVTDFGEKSYCLGEIASSQSSSQGPSDLKNIFDYIFSGKKLNYDVVKKYYFLLEACEYERHFLNLHMDSAIITNLELEHTDYFQDWEDYESAFVEMVEKLKDQVFVLSDLKSEKILGNEKTKIVDKQHFDFQYLWGDHQQQNASLVFGLLNILTRGEKNPIVNTGPDVEPSGSEIRSRIEQFKGIWRRMEFLKTTKNGAQIFSDYGHVASSLEVGLKALREKFPEKKSVCIFQPHQMHRILQGWNDFPKALQGYDQTFIYDIYAAREKIEDFQEDFKKLEHSLDCHVANVPRNDKGIKSVEDLGEVFAQHCGSVYLRNFEEVERIIENADENEVIVVYSAGDIDYKLRKYLQLL